MNHNCMDHRPPYGQQQFTCPVCGKQYVLANEFPGNYWMAKEEKDEMIRKSAEFIAKFRAESGKDSNLES